MKRVFGLLLVFAAVTGLDATDSFWKPAHWTANGVQFVGSYHPASNPKQLTWVLLHGLGSNRGEWDGFSRKAAAQGAGVLAVDLRGHGDSVKDDTGKSSLNYQEWRQAGPHSPWSQMPSDLAAAIAFLRESLSIPESKAAVGGASLGANIALLYAAEHPQVPAVMLLSPGLEYAGLATEKAFQSYGSRACFLAASPGDAYAFSTVQAFARRRTDPGLKLVQGPGAEHGVNMFKDPTFTEKAVRWATAPH